MCLSCLIIESTKRVEFVIRRVDKVFVDNKLVITLAKNPIYHDQNKHIDTRYHYIRECIARKDVHLKYMKTHDQVAASHLRKKISSS